MARRSNPQPPVTFRPKFDWWQVALFVGLATAGTLYGYLSAGASPLSRFLVVLIDVLLLWTLLGSYYQMMRKSSASIKSSKKPKIIPQARAARKIAGNQPNRA